MKNVSIHDAKTNLSKYIQAAKRGERVQIGRFGQAEVALVPLSTTAAPGKRVFGVAKAKITAQKDAFSPSTDALVANLLLGGH